MTKTDLTAEQLRALLDYDPVTGKFSKKTKSTYIGYRKKFVGQKNAAGYIQIILNGHTYRAQRLAWLYVYGMWPTGVVDHINGMRDNNAIANLRDVTVSVNGQNMKSANKDSESGLLGVCKAPRGKWIASICLNRKRMYLGIFPTKEQAHDAYLSAKRKMHEGCTI